MATNRRGFLKALGLGSAGALATTAAAAGSYVIGIDVAKDSSDKTALNFMCQCGESVIAVVPNEVGGVIEVPCTCGRNWRMEWMGDHFQTKDTTAPIIPNEEGITFTLSDEELKQLKDRRAFRENI